MCAKINEVMHIQEDDKSIKPASIQHQQLLLQTGRGDMVNLNFLYYENPRESFFIQTMLKALVP